MAKKQNLLSKLKEKQQEEQNRNGQEITNKYARYITEDNVIINNEETAATAELVEDETTDAQVKEQESPNTRNDAKKTGGRKLAKDKSDSDPTYMNMAFKQVNYNIIEEESDRCGVSKEYIVNEIVRMIKSEEIDKYLDSFLVKPNKDHISRRKGARLPRLNYGLESDNYSRCKDEAEKRNMTITQYVNCSIEVFASKR